MAVMTNRQLTINEDQYFDLVSFIVSSAQLMHEGEQYEELYPSIRLMDIAARLTKIIADNGGFEGESWPQSFVENYKKSISLLDEDQKFLINFIQDTILELVNRMKLTKS